MGPAPVSQFRPPLPDANPNIRKNNATEKRKRAAPKRLMPATPKPTTAHPPLPETPTKPKNDVPDNQPLPLVPVHESTPCPGAGKMLLYNVLSINQYIGNITTKCHSGSMGDNRDLTRVWHQKISSLPVSIASDTRCF